MWTRDEIEALYRRHAYSVSKRCQSLLKNEAEAKDMVQEVFVRAIEQPDAFQGRASPATYLFALATNLCFQRMRNSALRNEAWQNALSEQLSKGTESPADTTEARALLEKILKETDEQTALIALYHFLDGLAQGEIGELVGLSRVTINQKLQKFRSLAKAVVEGEQ